MSEVKLTRQLKVKLLRAIQSGSLDTSDFPELFYIASPAMALMSDEQIDKRIEHLQTLLKLEK